MCIRDRVNSPGHDQLQLEHKHKPQLNLSYTHQNMHLLIQVCLLYTSDAADERSSVDLGGRRIIKKKKYEDNADRPITQ